MPVLLSFLTIHSLCAVFFLLLVRYSSVRVDEGGVPVAETIPARVEGS